MIAWNLNFLVSSKKKDFFSKKKKTLSSNTITLNGIIFTLLLWQPLRGFRGQMADRCWPRSEPRSSGCPAVPGEQVWCHFSPRLDNIEDLNLSFHIQTKSQLWPLIKNGSLTSSHISYQNCTGRWQQLGTVKFRYSAKATKIWPIFHL